MYTRYKVVNKNRGWRKFIVPVLILSSVLYGGYRFRHHLQFWKYSSNKLMKRIEDVSKIRNRERRREELGNLVSEMDGHKSANLTDPDAYLMSGRVHFKLGESYLPGSFTELVINGRSKEITPPAKREFLEVIKNVRKAMSLVGSGKPGMEMSLLLVKACYYTDFMPADEMKKIILTAGGPGELTEPEDIRFYSVLLILNKEEDGAISLLTKQAAASKGIQGKLFLATCEKISKRYTNSIIHFSDVLGETGDEGIRKLVYRNLGEIYFTQSLFQESITQFIKASEIDANDADIKLWIVKNYSALGEKTRAREVLNEILQKDRTNPEAKRLMGTL